MVFVSQGILGFSMPNLGGLRTQCMFQDKELIVRVLKILALGYTIPVMADASLWTLSGP